jgi:hypothetical protein
MKFNTLSLGVFGIFAASSMASQLQKEESTTVAETLERRQCDPNDPGCLQQGPACVGGGFNCLSQSDGSVNQCGPNVDPLLCCCFPLTCVLNGDGATGTCSQPF